MEKQDILVVILAIACFSVMAIVVKPILATHSPGNPLDRTLSPTPIPSTPGVPSTTPPGKGFPTDITPTPAPTWDRSVKAIPVTIEQLPITPGPTIPPDVAPNRSLVTYAVISDRWSGTTESLYIPAPYWILEYTAEPLALPPDAFPRLIIQVFDTRDPNRDVRIISQDIYEGQPEDPWVEKFYEGKREYSFRISTRFLKSYTLTIKVPVQYT